MKKSVVLWSVVLLWVTSLVLPTTTANASGIKVYVQNKLVQFDSSPINKNGRVMVPIRQSMEALGVDVQWNGKTQSAMLKKGGQSAQVTIGSKKAFRNGKSFALDTTPFMKNNRVYVPLRFISESFGLNVTWDAKKQTVYINDSTSPKTVAERIPVLMYHNITDKVTDGSNISPKRFAQHMDLIHAQGYTTITDYDLYAHLVQGKTLPKKPILITFDDGYKSNYTYGYPVLKKYGMKATINLIVSRVEGTSNRYPNETPKISWEEARISQDVFLFQGHTNDSHYKAKSANGTQLGVIAGRIYKSNGKLETQSEFENRLLHDLTISKQKIEQELGKEVITLAYPYGSYSGDTIRIAKKAGYKMAFTVKAGVVQHNNASLFELKRVTASGTMSAQDLLKEMNKY